MTPHPTPYPNSITDTISNRCFHEKLVSVWKEKQDHYGNWDCSLTFKIEWFMLVVCKKGRDYFLHSFRVCCKFGFNLWLAPSKGAQLSIHQFFVIHVKNSSCYSLSKSLWNIPNGLLSKTLWVVMFRSISLVDNGSAQSLMTFFSVGVSPDSIECLYLTLTKTWLGTFWWSQLIFTYNYFFL